jgi:MFS family permease
VPAFARLYAALLLGRTAGAMVGIAFILFVLARYHSPQLAGLTAFFSIIPGLLVSPVAGALLDRHGRARLLVLDYFIAAIAVGVIAALSAGHALPPVVLLVIVGVASLTNPLSSTGARSLFPIIAPPALWERANALDSSAFLISSLVGAPVAGALIALIGPEWALASTGLVFAAAELMMLRLRDPSVKAATEGSIFFSAWRGLQYTVRNATLRGLALTLGTFNLSWGILEIALPVLVLGRLHQGPAAVGFLWGLLGAAGLLSSLVSGRIASRGRERQLMLFAILAEAAALVALPFATAFWVVAAVIVVVGIANGPFDIGLFTLRQRRTDPAWFGRAFAVSMAANFIGTPIGAAFAGPLIGVSVNLALWSAVAVALAAAIFLMLAIPAGDHPHKAAVPVS